MPFVFVGFDGLGGADGRYLARVPGDRSGLTVRDARVREREHLVPLPEHPFDAEVVVPIVSGKTPYLRFERDPQ